MMALLDLGRKLPVHAKSSPLFSTRAKPSIWSINAL
jgi:hypothetical protein